MNEKNWKESTIQERLIFVRKRCGKTQQDVADLLGVTPSAVGNWESGAYMIPPNRVDKFCATLGINRKFLESGEGKPFAEIGEDRRVVTPYEYARTFGCDHTIASLFAAICESSPEDKARISNTLKFFAGAIVEKEQNEQAQKIRDFAQCLQKR